VLDGLVNSNLWMTLGDNEDHSHIASLIRFIFSDDWAAVDEISTDTAYCMEHQSQLKYLLFRSRADALALNKTGGRRLKWEPAK